MGGKLIWYVKGDKDTIRSIKLSLCCEDEEEVLKEKGIGELRRRRLLRVLKETSSQGVKLTYTDLTLILLTSKSTIKRDLKANGIW